MDLVDVPELGYAVVDGQGAPEGADFAAALEALYPLAYGAHFIVRKRFGAAPRVMPLEAQWWVDDPRQQTLVEAVAAGEGDMGRTDRAAWRWRALIMQPDPIGEADVREAISQAMHKHPSPALERVRYVRWEEGPCAQVLHVGPYADEGPSLRQLHEAIAAAGLRPRGRHHEIYLGDPRRAAPEKLRTLLRQPVEPPLVQG